jgi:hypothetical protein
MGRGKIGTIPPLLPLMLYMGLCGMSCTSTTSPHQPAPEKEEFYDYVITYQRTAILKPENGDPSELVIVLKGTKRIFPITKLDDYTFTCEASSLSTHVKADELSHAIYIVDFKRFEAEWITPIHHYGRPYSVGDIFIFKCKQTGVEKQLTNIIANTYIYGLPAKSFPKMAPFRILKGGTIVDP